MCMAGDCALSLGTAASNLSEQAMRKRCGSIGKETIDGEVQDNRDSRRREVGRAQDQSHAEGGTEEIREGESSQIEGEAGPEDRGQEDCRQVIGTE